MVIDVTHLTPVLIGHYFYVLLDRNKLDKVYDSVVLESLSTIKEKSKDKFQYHLPNFVKIQENQTTSGYGMNHNQSDPCLQFGRQTSQNMADFGGRNN